MSRSLCAMSEESTAPDVERFKALLGMHLMTLKPKDRRAEMQRITQGLAEYELTQLEEWIKANQPE